MAMNGKEAMGLHIEYSARFHVEFEQLMEQKTFAEVWFQNFDLIIEVADAPFLPTLNACFGWAFEGMALGLSRLWDGPGQSRKDGSHLHSLSIPVLVTHLEEKTFLGCHGLLPDRDDRLAYDDLFNRPLCQRLRVARTETMAHSVQFGKSADRRRSDISDKREFDIVNGDLLQFCNDTLRLLFSLNDQLTIEKWRKGKTMLDMEREWRQRHLTFIRYFVSDAH
ncbi:hypothetical protein B6V75_03215 [Thioclava sp. F1Mire-8]|uniref:hypothetical protein n=1 Tax=Thioclava sp. F1Mire-8 TaxID=1973006 RepID=UPI000B53ECF6|nr:hypothetical protein [Thioclava sp. F1Mire-8]OWY05157.1 hypothetical protein B6V75_03215 [Thioclava sp. F1Mire-8]